jgi:glycosyltransferase involved in cell wall biosynthesis
MSSQMSQSPDEHSDRARGGPVEISVVVPVYLGEPFVEELYRRVNEALTPIVKSFELILVDDRGPDNSWRLIRKLSAIDPRVRGIQLSRNFGQHNAITAGLRAARGAWTVVMDCDLQDRPEEIPRLYARAHEGYDCVLARRAIRRDGWRKKTLSWLFYKVFNYFTDMNYDGTVGNFSIISRAVLNEINGMPEVFRFYGGLLAWMGFDKSYIDVEHDARSQGKSSYTLAKLYSLGANVIIAHSAKPLRLCVTAGIGVATLALLAVVYIIVHGLRYGTPVAGWPTLIVSIYFSTGAIIFTLGVLGLYVERIFTQVKARPVFIVKARTFDE